MAGWTNPPNGLRHHRRVADRSNRLSDDLQVPRHQHPPPRRQPVAKVPPLGIWLSGFRGNCPRYHVGCDCSRPGRNRPRSPEREVTNGRLSHRAVPSVPGREVDFDPDRPLDVSCEQEGGPLLGIATLMGNSTPIAREHCTRLVTKNLAEDAAFRLQVERAKWLSRQSVTKDDCEASIVASGFARPREVPSLGSCRGEAGSCCVRKTRTG